MTTEKITRAGIERSYGHPMMLLPIHHASPKQAKKKTFKRGQSRGEFNERLQA